MDAQETFRSKPRFPNLPKAPIEDTRAKYARVHPEGAAGPEQWRIFILGSLFAIRSKEF
jgi:hypothetical protein